MQKQVRIKAVNVRQTSRGDIFEVVADDNQEYATFARPIATQAQGLIGQLVNLGYSEKQKGQYTNRYCESVELAQEALPIGSVTFGSSSPPSFTPPPQGFTPSPTNAAQPDREIRIMRQTACKVAVGLLPYLPPPEQTPQGLLTMADFLVDYFVEGISPGNFGAPAGDPGRESPMQTADDDIPFTPTLGPWGL